MPTATLRVIVTGEELDAGWNGDRAEYAASVEAALYEVQGDNGMAYRPSIEHVPAGSQQPATLDTPQETARMETAAHLATVLDPQTCFDLGPSLTCAEADAFAAFLDAWGALQAAASLQESHAAADDQGDAHWVGP